MSHGDEVTSQLNLQQQQGQQQQHPLLAAILENNNAQTQRMHYYPNHYYPSHYFPGHYHQGHQGHQAQQGQQGQLGRPPLLAAASSHNGAYAPTASGSGHSGYGSMEPSEEYELQHGPPSGSFSSFHPSSSGASGPAYPPHHPPPPEHLPPPPTKSSKKSKKKSGGSVMNALTLLSFFFFINILQNCLKDHVMDMNPTVMVLTASDTRNRFNKLSEMNSREQTSTTATESAAASSWNQAALVPAVEPSVPPSIVTPTVVLQSPYSGVLEVANKPHQLDTTHYQPQANLNPHHDYRPHIVDHDDDDYNYGQGQRRPHTPSPPRTDFYPNRTTATHIEHFESDSGSDYYQHHYNPYAGTTTNSRRHPWSYGSRRYSSAPWSSASLGAQSGVSSYLDNAQRRQGDDDDGHGYGYGHRVRNRDRDGHADGDGDGDWMEDEDGQQRRRGDAFYTRTRIN
ncbi:putative uncharacterized protein DDB_G0291608 [Drosophila elegans]|uniref:putative uncharacterized protein DDB_G0291608 n=1 Tax=Drosophila elegans TaxID=30023 RepID=UPI0007E8998E|nr:putative uncharacterized protein DDB_G0291608 [Drosophila elegans]